MKKINVLLTSVGRRSYLVEYFKEALKGNGEVFASNSTDVSPAFQVADHSVITPLIYDDYYIPFLVKYCKEHKIDAVLSLFDADLPILAAHRKQFENNGTRLIVSDSSVLNITNDKWNTYNFLIDNGFQTPKTFVSLNNAIRAINNGEVFYPVIVKPRWGCGSIGVFEAENEEELKVLYEKSKGKVKQSYLKYESSVDFEHCVIIQEKINGQEYGLDIINDLNGSFCTTVVRMKYAMRSGETDCAITVAHKEFKKIGKQISEKLGHIANLDCDAFETPDGRHLVLELNARFGGGYPFSHMAGINELAPHVSLIMIFYFDEAG